MEKDTLIAPFPYFGGKSTIADEIWSVLGDVGHYIEPFFGSGAVLLNRPKVSGLETVNDKDAVSITGTRKEISKEINLILNLINNSKFSKVLGSSVIDGGVSYGFRN